MKYLLVDLGLWYFSVAKFSNRLVKYCNPLVTQSFIMLKKSFEWKGHNNWMVFECYIYFSTISNGKL